MESTKGEGEHPQVAGRIEEATVCVGLFSSRKNVGRSIFSPHKLAPIRTVVTWSIKNCLHNDVRCSLLQACMRCVGIFL